MIIPEQAVARDAEELLARAQYFVDCKYVARSDARQKEMGLAYVEAERADLARQIASFTTNEIKRAAQPLMGVQHPEDVARLHKAIEEFIYDRDGLVAWLTDRTNEASSGDYAGGRNDAYRDALDFVRTVAFRRSGQATDAAFDGPPHTGQPQEGEAVSQFAPDWPGYSSMDDLVTQILTWDGHSDVAFRKQAILTALATAFNQGTTYCRPQAGCATEVREFLDDVITWDQKEQRKTVEVAPAGNTYESTFVDGPLARRARKLLAAPPPVAESGWQEIETAPKDGEQILGCWSASKMMEVVYHSSAKGPYGFRWANEGGFVSTPTHWRPLPAPPQIAAVKS